MGESPNWSPPSSPQSVRQRFFSFSISDSPPHCHSPPLDHSPPLRYSPPLSPTCYYGHYLSRSPSPRTLSRTPSPRTLSRSPSPRTLNRTPTPRTLSRSPSPPTMPSSPSLNHSPPLCYSPPISPNFYYTHSPTLYPSPFPSTLSRSPTPPTLSRTPSPPTLSRSPSPPTIPSSPVLFDNSDPLYHFPYSFPTYATAGPSSSSNEDVKRKQQKSKNIICLICQNNPPSHVFLDCGHAVTCEECVYRFRISSHDGDDDIVTRCPMCRQLITQQPMKLYFSEQ